MELGVKSDDNVERVQSYLISALSATRTLVVNAMHLYTKSETRELHNNPDTLQQTGINLIYVAYITHLCRLQGEQDQTTDGLFYKVSNECHPRKDMSHQQAVYHTLTF